MEQDAPKIEPGRGRLTYNKARRTIVSERPPVPINESHDLYALLATMKSAKEQRVNMSIWDRDIKAVEDAIVVIEAIRDHKR